MTTPSTRVSSLRRRVLVCHSISGHFYYKRRNVWCGRKKGPFKVRGNLLTVTMSFRVPKRRSTCSGHSHCREMRVTQGVHVFEDLSVSYVCRFTKDRGLGVRVYIFPESRLVLPHLSRVPTKSVYLSFRQRSCSLRRWNFFKKIH